MQALQPDGQFLPGLKPGASGNGDCVQAEAAWFGVYDMPTLTEQAQQAVAISRKVDGTPEWRLLGCTATNCPPDLLRSASPALSLDQTSDPMLLVTGDRDKIVPPAQSLQFAQELAAQDIPHELPVIPGAGHNLNADDNIGTTRALQQAQDRTGRFSTRIWVRAPRRARSRTRNLPKTGATCHAPARHLYSRCSDSSGLWA